MIQTWLANTAVLETMRSLRTVTRLLRSKEGEQLWDVLTALRGPDVQNEEVKRATTGVIRYFLLGASVPGCTTSNPDAPELAAVRRKLVDSHFTGHARKAFRVLGLKWRSCNALVVE